LLRKQRKTSGGYFLQQPVGPIANTFASYVCFIVQTEYYSK